MLKAQTLTPGLDDVLELLEAHIDIQSDVRSIIRNAAAKGESVFLALREHDPSLYSYNTKGQRRLNTTRLNELTKQAYACGVQLEHASAGHDAKAVLGVIGEALTEQLLNTPTGVRNQKGYDVLFNAEQRIEVKTTVKGKVKLSKAQYGCADYLLIFTFNEFSNELVQCKLIPMEVLKAVKALDPEHKKEVSVVLDQEPIKSQFNITLRRLHDFFRCEYEPRECQACELTFLNSADIFYLELSKPCILGHQCAFYGFQENRYRYFKHKDCSRNQFIASINLLSHTLYLKYDHDGFRVSSTTSDGIEKHAVDGSKILDFALRYAVYPHLVAQKHRISHFKNGRITRISFVQNTIKDRLAIDVDVTLSNQTHFKTIIRPANSYVVTRLRAMNEALFPV
ncbi:hypothetical protein QX220_02185 [Vibrio vulnificus]|uniref:DUF6998 domain-containing protein n=1 Tax=Vibrio vulnificus TaxID=672 RepID=UPI001A18534E|nr:hypothetical protein [Vibrio vulnificus]MDS1860441.1 hypothetical protein [Vibrio vulnificus]HAS6385349.1 hypothetical protein [Vibrio vulnificus]HDY7624865.1 hypothetical protein [Vibrio vulnificus]HEB2782251.1 hypothetical protein [Vibrio vulnificus]